MSKNVQERSELENQILQADLSVRMGHVDPEWLATITEVNLGGITGILLFLPSVQISELLSRKEQVA